MTSYPSGLSLQDHMPLQYLATEPYAIYTAQNFCSLQIDDLCCFCVDFRASFLSATQTRGIEIAFPPYELIVED